MRDSERQIEENIRKIMSRATYISFCSIRLTLYGEIFHQNKKKNLDYFFCSKGISGMNEYIFSIYSHLSNSIDERKVRII